MTEADDPAEGGITMDEAAKHVQITGFLKKADEIYNEALIIQETGSTLSTIERAKQAMICAVMALMAKSDKHSTDDEEIVAFFEREYSRGGIFPDTFADWLRGGVELQNRIDFDATFRVSEEMAEQLIRRSGQFVERVRGYLESDQEINRGNIAG
jgi:uncharacterized protein (UPF0332 family)